MGVSSLLCGPPLPLHQPINCHVARGSMCPHLKVAIDWLSPVVITYWLSLQTAAKDLHHN